MTHETSHQTEDQLRRELAELRRQLAARDRGERRPAARWQPSRATIGGLLAVAGVVLALAFVAGYVPLQRREAALRAETRAQEDGPPRVVVLHVARGSERSELELPGTMQAVTEAPILARTDGYLKRRLVDIGDRVRAGQVVAEIDAPELDQQVQQAEAAVEQAQAAVQQAEANLAQGTANRDLARITAERSRPLTARGIIPQQDGDQAQAQLAAQEAGVRALERAVSAQRSSLAAAKANLARLEELQRYRLVRAPFDGVITLRNLDVGALVSSGSTLLYRIAQTRVLRTYLNVPQSSVPSIHVGQTATLTVSQFPGRTFRGTATRTMLVEVDVPNGDGALLPGTYTEVALSGARANPPLVVPAAAMVFRADGPQVALVDAAGIVHLQKVVVGRDDGDRIEILQGVEEGAAIIAAPGDTAREGARVVPIERDGEPR